MDEVRLDVIVFVMKPPDLEFVIESNGKPVESSPGTVGRVQADGKVDDDLSALQV
jgi:hypothetical protein